MDRLLDEARRNKRPFRAVVNDTLRAGLAHGAEQPNRYVVPARDMGLRDGVQLDDISQLLEEIKGPLAR